MRATLTVCQLFTQDEYVDLVRSYLVALIDFSEGDQEDRVSSANIARYVDVVKALLPEDEDRSWKHAMARN